MLWAHSTPSCASVWRFSLPLCSRLAPAARAGRQESPAPFRFARIAPAGHSSGQVIAEIEAYSFGDIEALVVGGWGDPAITPEDLVVILPFIQVCAMGGEPKRPGEPSGYAFI